MTVQRSALARVLKVGGTMLQRTGLAPVSLDEELLFDSARRQTGLHDFGAGALREGLRRLLASFEQEARLSLVGRVAARKDMTRLLANRLRMTADRARHPEIAAQRIRRPLFITGLPRSGTTLLHGLLANDPVARAPLSWEMLQPSPFPRGRHSSALRIADAEWQIRWFHRLMPSFQAIHATGARLPEECLIITSHSFRSFQFQTTHHVPTYQRWLEAQDLREAYVGHHAFLQHLQWQGDADSVRWILKAPAHLFGLRALFASYPDAGVIMTHRQPLEVVGSLASLTTTLRSTFSDAVDPRQIGPEMAERWARGMTRALRDRDEGVVPRTRILDVRYLDLVRDPVGTVRRIYEHFDLDFTPEVEARLGLYAQRNPKDKNGRHRYDLRTFGLDADAEEARYAGYRERFGL